LKDFLDTLIERQLFNFLRTIEPKPKNIILNHGEASAIKAFANYIRDDRLGYKPFIYTPAILDSLRVA